MYQSGTGRHVRVPSSLSNKGRAMFRLAIAAALLAVPGAAMAQDAAAPDNGPPERIRSIILYNDQKCPEPEGDEIVVCAQESDSPYRIPSKLRESIERPDAVSWATRVDDVMEANRAGLPNSCSPIGSGGQSGCTVQMIRQWRAERAANQRREAAIP